MKNIFFKIIIFTGLLVYISCNNEPVELFPIAQEDEEEPVVDPVPDPEIPEEQEDVVGTWSLIDIESIEGKLAGQQNGQTYTQFVSGRAGNYDYQISFNEEGGFQSAGSFTLSFDYFLNGQDYTEDVVFQATDFLSSGSYTRYSSRLTLSSNGMLQDIEFITIEDSGLVLISNLNKLYYLSEMPINFTGILDATFERIP